MLYHPHCVPTHLPYIQVTEEIVVFIRKLNNEALLFTNVYVNIYMQFIYLFAYLINYLFIDLFRDLFIYLLFIVIQYLFIN